MYNTAYKSRGRKRILRAINNRGIVRFYSRDAKGRFASFKFVLIPYHITDTFIHGKVTTINHRGIIVTIRDDKDIPINAINWQTVKRVR